DLITKNDTIFLLAVNTIGSSLRVFSLGTSILNTPQLIQSYTFPGITNSNSLDVMSHCGEYYGIVSSNSDGKIGVLSFGSHFYQPPTFQLVNYSGSFAQPTKVFLT